MVCPESLGFLMSTSTYDCLLLYISFSSTNVCKFFFLNIPDHLSLFKKLLDLAANVHHFTCKKSIFIVLKAQQQYKQPVYFQHKINHDKMLKTEHNFSYTYFSISCCPNQPWFGFYFCCTLLDSPAHTEISLVEKTLLIL